MNRVLTLLLASACLAACASQPVRPSIPDMPGEMRTAPERYVLVTVRNRPAALPTRAGSTPRGYDMIATYGVSAEARRAAREIASEYGLQEAAAWPIQALRVHCLVYRVPDGLDRDAIVARLAADPRVELAQPLQTFATSASAYNDRYVDLQRGFADMSVAAAHRWSLGVGVTVAVVDSGIDASHPDLDGRVRVSLDFVDPGAARPEGGRHGTEVAGVIAAVGNNGRGIVGVAPGVELLALRACWQPSPSSASAQCSTFTLAMALGAAIEARADVINLSLVGPPDRLLAALVEEATAHGAIVVGAVPASGRLEGFPAGAPGVLAVDMAERPVSVQALQAPGQEILTLAPDGGYDFASGSSLAVANVTGTVALLRARRHVTAPQARSLLEQSMRSVPGAGGTVRSINACEALAALLASGECPTVVLGSAATNAARPVVDEMRRRDGSAQK
jgi:subtilisin family serine protease